MNQSCDSGADYVLIPMFLDLGVRLLIQSPKVLKYKSGGCCRFEVISRKNNGGLIGDYECSIRNVAIFEIRVKGRVTDSSVKTLINS